MAKIFSRPSKLLLGAVALRACAVLALSAALGAGAAALVLAALVGGALALAARAAGADGAAGAGGAALLLVAAGGSFGKKRCYNFFTIKYFLTGLPGMLTVSFAEKRTFGRRSMGGQVMRGSGFYTVLPRDMKGGGGGRGLQLRGGGPAKKESPRPQRSQFVTRSTLRL